MTKIVASAWVGAFSVCLAAGAADVWLTPEEIDASAQELVDRMAEAGFQQISPPEKVLEGARQMIVAMHADVEKRGEAGLAELAPAFDGLELPGSGSALLDGMGSYNLCFVALSVRLRDPAIAEDANARLSTTLGVSATALASYYLRHRFLVAGGEAGALRAYTADEGRQAMFNGLFRDPQLRATVLAGCQPAVRELVASSFKSLIEGALFE